MRRITRWNPNREMTTFTHDMDRLFNGLWTWPGTARMAKDTLGGSWIPPVNILEKADAIRIEVELPGMSADDIDVTVENGVLSIRGERSFEEGDEGEKYHRFESRYGSFERRFTLPTSVDAAKIEARFDKGVMTVSLPKREESLPRTGKVKIS